MGPGKIASQAGHAYLGAWENAYQPLKNEYHKDDCIGTKVCLSCENERELTEVFEKARALGIPSYYVVDSGNNTIFNGVPTATAVGVGPCTKAEAKFLKRYQLMK